MNQQKHIPDPETAKKLLNSLRQTHREMEEFILEIAEINALLEHNLRQQKLNRLRSHR